MVVVVVVAVNMVDNMVEDVAAVAEEHVVARLGPIGAVTTTTTMTTTMTLSTRVAIRALRQFPQHLNHVLCCS